ncbi:MBL fold metallo-hydrolase [Rhizobium leguminosarum]
MADFYELDFLAVETQKSGDAISVRYSLNGEEYIHVIDGGFAETGERLVAHLQSHYGGRDYIDHVVATHPDGDHTVGLRAVLEAFDVRALWMLRPWHYVDLLLPGFPTYTSRSALVSKLRELYPNLAALEDIATDRGIPIYEPLQGATIGVFTVLAPSLERFLSCVWESDRTPETSVGEKASAFTGLASLFVEVAKKAINYTLASWGLEAFSPEPISRENEMSVVQYGVLCGQRIFLTADAGRDGLTEALDYAPYVGISFPGVDKFQVPHHGSRRNLSSEICDRILGPKLPAKTEASLFHAYISSAKADLDHPRKVVIRACIHRGGDVYMTEGQSIVTGVNRPSRSGWTNLVAANYPHEQEDA